VILVYHALVHFYIFQNVMDCINMCARLEFLTIGESFKQFFFNFIYLFIYFCGGEKCFETNLCQILTFSHMGHYISKRIDN